MLRLVESRWNKNQPERGTTEVRFTIARDGSIDPNTITVVKPSGYTTLDRVSRGALYDLRLPPLPPQYPNSTLTVRLSFAYGAL
jgi:outer membrane biosynthesis protein TonB